MENIKERSSNFLNAKTQLTHSLLRDLEMPGISEVNLSFLSLSFRLSL